MIRNSGAGHRMLGTAMVVVLGVAAAQLFAQNPFVPRGNKFSDAYPDDRVRPNTDLINDVQPISDSLLEGAPKTAPAGDVRPKTELLDDVRRDIGRSLETPLFNTPPADKFDRENEFRSALERVANESPDTPSRLAPAPDFDRAVPDLSATTDVSTAYSLRRAGRTLDSLAADAEDAADYASADRLRKLARQIRLEARRLADH